MAGLKPEDLMNWPGTMALDPTFTPRTFEESLLILERAAVTLLLVGILVGVS